MAPRGAPKIHCSRFGRNLRESSEAYKRYTNRIIEGAEMPLSHHRPQSHSWDAGEARYGPMRMTPMCPFMFCATLQ